VSFCSVAAVTCASAILLYNQVAYHVLIAVFAAALAAYLAVSRRFRVARTTRGGAARHVQNAVLAALALGIGTIASWQVRLHENELDVLFFKLVTPRQQTGLSHKTELTSVRQLKSSEGIALRIESDHAPGYLRGQVLDEYRVNAIRRRPEWVSNGTWATLEPSAPPMLDHSDPAGRRNAFILENVDARGWNRITVWPASLSSPLLFMSLETAVVRVPVDSLQSNDNAVVKTEESAMGVDYACLTPVPDTIRGHFETAPLSDALSRRYTAVPADLDERIKTLARDLQRDRATTRGKIAAVARHLKGNYTYNLGITVPRGADPLAHFLFESPGAHCEYFATAAAVLLRLGGVPARYVTGFVPTSRNSYGDYWVARNADAHAWVEAYDEERGWGIVEATPPDGVPAAVPRGTLSQLWDYVRFRVAQVRLAFLRYGIRGVVAMCRRGVVMAGRFVLGTLPGLAAACAVVAAATVLIATKCRRIRAKRPRPDPAAAALRALLAKMDKRLRKCGLVRRPSETLHQFAERIVSELPDKRVAAQLATWYVSYARLRYGRQARQVDPATLKRFEHA
ncbi:MAG TPA: transglutaminase domain-containing protein, partial [Candidatus Hydrogenedentes bacterium]|nr:transglutaminase domain-containing protein [Candidatus Hydrogenedentota bacterium]